jgi:hypothetical protein
MPDEFDALAEARRRANKEAESASQATVNERATMRDFGMHKKMVNGIELQCRYVAPGVTMQDVVKEFEAGKARAEPGDDLAGDPSRWPTMRGLTAVTKLIVAAFEKHSR